jgi:hypothetical protein
MPKPSPFRSFLSPLERHHIEDQIQHPRVHQEAAEPAAPDDAETGSADHEHPQPLSERAEELSQALFDASDESCEAFSEAALALHMKRSSSPRRAIWAGDQRVKRATKRDQLRPHASERALISLAGDAEDISGTIIAEELKNRLYALLSPAEVAFVEYSMAGMTTTEMSKAWAADPRSDGRRYDHSKWTRVKKRVQAVTMRLCA